MEIDPSDFYKLNVIDTCAVWNVLSSRILFQTAVSSSCVFSCTAFIAYECLLKPRKTVTSADEQLQKRLQIEQRNGRFQVYHLDVEELLEVGNPKKRKNLGKGELSSIAFAKRTRQAFLTDDRGARKLAEQVMPEKMVQTTPHLFGWLYFSQRLGDGDKKGIISEHECVARPLRPHFEKMYQRALYYRLQANMAKNLVEDIPPEMPIISSTKKMILP